jgi:hypothetical protein
LYCHVERNVIHEGIQKHDWDEVRQTIEQSCRMAADPPQK